MICIVTKLKETQLTSITLSVFVANLIKMRRRIFFALLYLFQRWDRYERQDLQMYGRTVDMHVIRKIADYYLKNLDAQKLKLPLWVGMTREEMDWVVECVNTAAR